MPRYVIRAQRPRQFWVEDDHDLPEMRHDPLPTVSDHEPADTGLLDRYGNTLWRLPDPIGFGRRND